MTNSLITVFDGTIQNTQIQLCNARELHSFVESKQQYSHWISDRITDYGFVQDEDYIIVTERTAGRPRKEYHITLDMGKELAMVERNEKGRQIRKYFIECERKMKELLQNNQQNLPLALPEKKYTFEFTEDELQSLIWAWFAFVRGIHTFRYIYPMFQKLGSNIAPEIYGQGFEYSHTAQSAHKILERITKEFDYDPMTNWRVLKHVRGFDPAFKKPTF
ncbi:TPA: antA/AntB antirepressor family protein [Mannheimia haemolytica]|nr:antA/AntB antirepressor family protein [Mannheimia haemolytica]HDL6065251.1 antA/AntB antirepressor family protein [Mannheimia haemolytica]HDZ3669526.1 antA/AntB antirepressor family protein [Mannheimia haemolytica]